MNEKLSVLEILAKADYAFVAFIIVMGAVSNAAIEFSTNRRNPKLKTDWIDFLISFFVSCFSGTVFGIGAAHLDQSNLVISLVAAGGAFLGVNGLNVVTETLLVVFRNFAGKYGSGGGGGGNDGGPAT